MQSITPVSSRDEIVSNGEEYMDWQDRQIALALQVKETEGQKTVIIFGLLSILILLWGTIIW